MAHTTVLKVASRWVSAQFDDDEDGPHDPSDGVIYQWQYDSLENKAAWKGYTYRLATWVWNNPEDFDEGQEPDEWGDNRPHGPFKTLEAVLNEIRKYPIKRWGEWISRERGTFESVSKKRGKAIMQGIVTLNRVDGKPLTYDEYKEIEHVLKVKRW